MVGQEIEVYVELGKETCGIRYEDTREVVASGLNPEVAVDLASLMRKYKKIGSASAFHLVYTLVNNAANETKLPVLDTLRKEIEKLAEWPRNSSEIEPELNKMLNAHFGRVARKASR